MKKKNNTREEIISLMRGFFVCPIIAFFHKNDLVRIFLKKRFLLKEFKTIKNKNFLKKILNYFCSLGLLNKSLKNNYFQATKTGRKIFLRSGSFLLLHSYKPFFNNLDTSLKKELTINAKCERAENVKGSGSINNKKFFPEAINLIKNDGAIGLIADIGCGDGNFLNEASKKFLNIPLFASDISKVAVDAARKKLRDINNTNKSFLVCDALNVEKWSKEIKKIKLNNNSKVLISIWYILHEISKSDPRLIIKFFEKIKKNIPNAILLIGEITKFNNTVLNKNKKISIMPEFLFFHEISGQGVLKYNDYKTILKKIPYTLKNSINFDIVKEQNKKTPSAFVWLLS